MLKEEIITKIAGLIKVAPDKLKAALADTKESDVEIPEDIQVFTKEELETRDTNKTNDGIKTGKEIGVKEVRKAAGLEDSTGKDPAKIAQAIIDKAIADAKIKPDDKVKELTTQIETLKKTISDKDLEVESAKGQAAGVSLDRKIFSTLPKERSDVLNDDEFIGSVKSVFKIKNVDGKEILERDGKDLRDQKTGEPLPMKTVVADYFKERKGWITDGGAGAAGGRGAGDKGGTGGVFTKRSEVIEHFEKQGISLTGEKSKEITAKLGELAKADPTFDMNN